MMEMRADPQPEASLHAPNLAPATRSTR
jgi:hypothetical protein